MYLISGTLLFIASIFLIVANQLLNHLFITQNDPVIIFFAMLTTGIGILFYYLEHSNNKNEKS